MSARLSVLAPPQRGPLARAIERSTQRAAPGARSAWSLLCEVFLCLPLPTSPLAPPPPSSVSVDTVLSLTVAGLLPAHPVAVGGCSAPASMWRRWPPVCGRRRGVRSEPPPENGPRTGHVPHRSQRQRDFQPSSCSASRGSAYRTGANARRGGVVARARSGRAARSHLRRAQ
jgi:hypothetical protein